MYAGQFVGAMYAAAFFENDPQKIVEQALKAIPAESQYAEMVRDVLAWSKADPAHWEGTWQKCQEKYRKNPIYQKASNGGIDCKINGAYVLMGLLHGQRDLDQTILIACRGGQDSDCNPSSAGGVLFTTIGYSRLPERFNTGLDEEKIFSHTAYNFPRLLAVCEKLTRQILVKYGGTVMKEASGEEVFLIPANAAPKPSALELSWAPGPIANSVWTEEEKAKIKDAASMDMAKAVAKFAPGWAVKNCGSDMDPGLRAEWAGKKNVLATHPLDQATACVLSRSVAIQADKKSMLKLVVGHDPQGDFDLIVRADGKELRRKTVGPKTAVNHWLTEQVDLSAYAGKTVQLELLNQANGWAYEAAYWAEISLE
jgi:hypothetical protein